MAQQSSLTPQSHPPSPPRRRGFLTMVLWDMPWKIFGMLLVSLLLSLIVEYIGIAFFWSEQGAEHSREVMMTERKYFAEGSTRSLLSSTAVTSVKIWITEGYQWLFVLNGFIEWSQSVHQESNSNGVADELNAWGVWLMLVAREYLIATLYVTQVFLVRVTILILSIPLFILTALVGIVDGLVRRDVRRYCAGYESSFLYHHAKRLVKPALFIPCIVYLSVPFSVHPNTVLLPAALLMGLAISVTIGSFKKYL